MGGSSDSNKIWHKMTATKTKLIVQENGAEHNSTYISDCTLIYLCLAVIVINVGHLVSNRWQGKRCDGFDQYTIYVETIFRTFKGKRASQKLLSRYVIPEKNERRVSRKWRLQTGRLSTNR